MADLPAPTNYSAGTTNQEAVATATQTMDRVLADKLQSLTGEFNQILQAFLSGLCQLMPDKVIQLEMLSNTVQESDAHEQVFISSVANFLCEPNQSERRLDTLRVQRNMAVFDEYYEFVKAEGGVELMGAMLRELSARMPTFEAESVQTLWQYIDFMVNRAEEFALLSNSPPIDPAALDRALKAMTEWEAVFIAQHGRGPTTQEAVAHAQVLASQ
jgi:hypothetical protein